MQINHKAPSERRTDRSHAKVSHVWRKAPPHIFKCNVSASWINPQQNCGASWLLRDHHGTAMFHSRRYFSRIKSGLESELLGLSWAVEGMTILHQKKVIFECSNRQVREAILHPPNFPMYRPFIGSIRSGLGSLENWYVEFTPSTGNWCAEAIAANVTRDHRYQSYVAWGGPAWLHESIVTDSDDGQRNGVLH